MLLDHCMRGVATGMRHGRGHLVPRDMRVLAACGDLADHIGLYSLSPCGPHNRLELGHELIDVLGCVRRMTRAPHTSPTAVDEVAKALLNTLEQRPSVGQEACDLLLSLFDPRSNHE